MITIVDYDVGNLFSLASGCRAVGEEAEITASPERIAKAERILLPGVGAFGDAAEKLSAAGLQDALRQAAASGIPLMGICLGMQLLFQRSWEFGLHDGLGLLPGEIRPLAPEAPGLKIPQMGWNSLSILRPHPLLTGFPQGGYVYYVHSFYAADCEDNVVAASQYGRQVPGLVARGNVAGCQFHPEKSGSLGLGILRNFARWEGK